MIRGGRVKVSATHGTTAERGGAVPATAGFILPVPGDFTLTLRCFKIRIYEVRPLDDACAATCLGVTFRDGGQRWRILTHHTVAATTTRLLGRFHFIRPGRVYTNTSLF